MSWVTPKKGTQAPFSMTKPLVDHIGVPLELGGIFTTSDGRSIQIHHSNIKKDVQGRWLPGMTGNLSGRPTGTGKVRIDVQKKMNELNCCPFTILALIANGDQTRLKEKEPIPLNQRRSAATDLAKYLAPQLKSIDLDITTDDQAKARTIIILPSNGREAGKTLENILDDETDDIDGDCVELDE